MSTKIIHHQVATLQPTTSIIGTLDEDGGLACFRGIPYASFEKRWTHSRVGAPLGTVFDATKFGPMCPQGARPYTADGVLPDATPGMDEFNCLNLNITVPSAALSKSEGLLPVMVWVHGGAFSYGSNCIGRYNARGISLLAKSFDHPVVLVQINYRLGALGFASSSDLAAENESSARLDDSLRGVSGNYGFVDQQNAFQWIQNHIKDFGGDPSNVTAFGVSAGSASVHFHIINGSPLFDRAILMSGPASVLGPHPHHLYQEAWTQFCKNNGMQDATLSEKLEKLRALDPSEVRRTFPSRPAGPAADGKLLPKSWSIFQKQAPTRCKSIILGDVSYEGIVLDRYITASSQEGFHRALQAHFSPLDAQHFCEYFNFAEGSSLESHHESLRNLITVLGFEFPNFMVAEQFSGAGPAYLFHFEEPSPFPGPAFGKAYHGLSALFMYQNQNSDLPGSSQRIAREMGEIWTKFAYKTPPWQAYEKNHVFMRFGPGGTNGIHDISTDETRRYKYLEWMRGHHEEVLNFFWSLPLAIKQGK